MWDLDARPHEITLLKIKHIRLREKYGVITSSLTNITTEPLVSTEGKKQQQLHQDYRHTGENRHSKNIGERSNESEKELNNEHLKPDLKSKIKDEELEKSNREQKILLKEYKQNIIDFLLYNKDSIRIKDLDL
jgi:hypothetical protein